MATAVPALDLLAHGRVTLKGRLPRSSDATFLVEVAVDGSAALAVYKPGRGERPLWDFPPGLYLREAAAYHLSDALGWGLVPPTVLREGPLLILAGAGGATSAGGLAVLAVAKLRLPRAYKAKNADEGTTCPREESA